MAFNADSEYYFYEQKQFHTFPKRLKKIPEDLPDSLKFAHLNPKVAAFLASKEKQKHEEDLHGDGSNRKSLMPEINQAFNTVKGHLDSSLCNDEDSQRYLFEEARRSAGSVLLQLSHIIYYYDNIASHIPRSLEYQMMSGYCELTSDVQMIYREWQTQASREAYLKRLVEAQMEHSQEKVTVQDDGRISRSQSQISESGRSIKKRLSARAGIGLPEIAEDGTAENGHHNIKLSDSHTLHTPKHNKQERHKTTDTRGLGLMTGKSSKLKRGHHDVDNMSTVTETSDLRSMTNPSYYMSVIQFQLSSKACEEKGWIYQKGKEEELAKEAILEYCVQRLQQELRNIKDQKMHETQMGLNYPVVMRYYGDARKEALLKYRKLPVKTSSNSSMKDGKPCIPNISEDPNEGRQLMLSTHIDGTTVVYYPSGRPAIVACTAGFGWPGFYTIVYDDSSDMKMLAAFTPAGRGVCYHTNGNVRLLSTTKGGHLANKDGRVTRQWKWLPTQVKLSTPVHFQLNQFLSFRCVAENYSIIVFTCQKETARFFVNAASGASNHKRDENEQLLTSYNFSSKAARELLRLCAPKVKSKLKRKKDKLTKELSELVKSMDNQDKLLYDLEADKELARLQRKARNLVDDWLEHYRVTIGLKSPALTQLSETPRKLCTGSFSAKTADRKEERRGSLDLTMKEAISSAVRSPSAPAKASLMKSRVDSIELEQTTSDLNAAPTVKFSHSMEYTVTAGEEKEETNLPFSSAFNEKLSRISESSQRSKTVSAYIKSAPSRQPTSMSLQERENTITSLNLCPVALRKQLLSDTSSQCRCTRDVVPYIMDLEYETYINEMAPRNQLQIIAVVSSLYPQTNLAETMLNQIYEAQNRNRTRPCPQCRSDMFRLLRYDINTAMEGSGHPQPFLLTQHNVVSGMFLIYAGGHLLFCDHIFNGYGNAKRDFKKQVMKSRLDYLRGLSLPRDFRFSPSHGMHGLRSPWGGEIGGAGVDHFGSPGTSLVCTLQDVSNLNLQDSQADNISSRIPELPPINLPSSQKLEHGTTAQLEFVDNGKLQQQKRLSQGHGLTRGLGHSDNKQNIISLQNNKVVLA